MNEITEHQNKQRNTQEISDTVNEIFTVLKAYYTSYNVVMKTQNDELSIRKQWVYDLAKSRINEDMLITGMNRAKSYSSEDKFCKWPCVSDFITWCHGLPSPDSAYYEAARNCHDLTKWNPSHAIVAIAGMGFWFDIRTERNAREVKLSYCKRYSDLVKRVINNESFDYEKPKLIERTVKRDFTEEEKKIARTYLDNLKKDFGKNKNQDTKQTKKMTHEELEERKRKIIESGKIWGKKEGLL